MKRKLKFLLKILLLVVVTGSCIALGLYSRHINKIIITQIENQRAYMIQTKENKIIMLDGGNSENAEYIEQAIIDKGGVVEAWFVTLADKNCVGALEKIIEAEKVQINNIYVSFNSEEWYLNSKADIPSRFFDILDSEEIRDKVQEVNLKQEFTIDNLYCKILKVKNPEYIDENLQNNQSMVIRISNNFENIIFLPDLSEDVKKEVFENNLDEIQNDGVEFIYLK